MNSNANQQSDTAPTNRAPSPLVVVIAVALTLLIAVVMIGVSFSPGADDPLRFGGNADAHLPVRQLRAADLEECLRVLNRTGKIDPKVVAAISDALTKARPVGTPLPDLLFVTFRQRNGLVSDVVVQVFENTGTGPLSVIHDDAGARSMLGDDLFGSADGLLGLIYDKVTYFGDDNAVPLVQRVFQASLRGNLNLLQQQTIEPLNVIAILPRAQKFLPSSLRARVRSVVINATLTTAQWQTRFGLLTEDKVTAEQVGFLLSAWRSMALSLADTFASGNTIKPLHDALKAATVQAEGNVIVAVAHIPSRAIFRVTEAVTEHTAPTFAQPDAIVHTPPPPSPTPPAPAPPATPPAVVDCPEGKVAVCHRSRTLCVSPEAVAAHLAHGDTNGPCAASQVSADATVVPQ